MEPLEKVGVRASSRYTRYQPPPGFILVCQLILLWIQSWFTLSYFNSSLGHTKLIMNSIQSHNYFTLTIKYLVIFADIRLSTKLSLTKKTMNGTNSRSVFSHDTYFLLNIFVALDPHVFIRPWVSNADYDKNNDAIIFIIPYYIVHPQQKPFYKRLEYL